MAYSYAWSGGSSTNANSGNGGSYSYAGPNGAEAYPTQKRGWFGWGSGRSGGGVTSSSSSSSSNQGGHYHSSTMTSGPGGTHGTYTSSDNPGHVYTWGSPAQDYHSWHPPGPSGPPPAYSQNQGDYKNPQDGTTYHTARNGQTNTVHTSTRTPHGSSSTMLSTTGNGQAYAHAQHGVSNGGKSGSWRWWPS